MSNFQAVATVTAAIYQLLTGPLGNDVPGAQVTVLGPNATGQHVPPVRVNLFLYQVTPNAFLRNADLPMRDFDADLTQRPTAAIDLHYLFSCYGSEATFEPQLELGSVLRTLHANSILSRDLIRQAIGPQGHPALSGSDLADQVELVKLTPLPLSVEDLSRLWSMFFQTEYALSVTYQATVVLIDGSAPARTPLPVRFLPNIYVETLQLPVVDAVTSSHGPGAPIFAGDTLVLAGRHLRADKVGVRIDGVDVTASLTVKDAEIRFTLPAWVSAGIHGVQVVHVQEMGTPLADHGGLTSDVVGFVLSPKITNGPTKSAVTQPSQGVYNATISMTVDPPVGQDQRASLFLNATAGGQPSLNFVLNPHLAIANLAFDVTGLKAGKYLVRVEVDGAQSQLDFTGGAYSGPAVTIP